MYSLISDLLEARRDALLTADRKHLSPVVRGCEAVWVGHRRSSDEASLANEARPVLQITVTFCSTALPQPDRGSPAP